tara:strand:- start:272 stop:511 length:240 start_codon:yes stop_codon:yes gene_type:complete
MKVAKKSLFKGAPKGKDVKSIFKKVGLYNLLPKKDQESIDLKLEDPFSLRDFDRMMDPYYDEKSEKSLAIEAFRKRYNR